MNEMNRLGYVPGQISTTLENVHADWCIYQMAKATGDEKTDGAFRQRALHYAFV